MDLKRVIAVSKSEKIQKEQYGGPRYESIDIWSSESEEVPADLPASDVEEVRSMLRDRVNADLANQKRLIIESLDPKNSPPFP